MSRTAIMYQHVGCKDSTSVHVMPVRVFFVWGVKSAKSYLFLFVYISKTHLTVHSNGQFPTLCVKNFICMSKPQRLPGIRVSVTQRPLSAALLSVSLPSNFLYTFRYTQWSPSFAWLCSVYLHYARILLALALSFH